MRKQVLIFGLVGGVLITLLQWTEFHFIVLEHSVAIYGVLIAILFAGAGTWFGTRLLAPRERIVENAVPAAPTPNFTADATARERLGITRRELEILELVGEPGGEPGDSRNVTSVVSIYCTAAVNFPSVTPFCVPPFWYSGFPSLDLPCVDTGEPLASRPSC
jgi:hypothetical protein